MGLTFPPSRLGSPSSPSSASFVILGPYIVGPSIRRSIVDQPLFYASLPPLLIPSISLLLPIRGQYLPCCFLEAISLISGADCMIFAAPRVIAVSARSEDVFFQARDVGHVVSLRPFKARTACRPVDRE